MPNLLASRPATGWAISATLFASLIWLPAAWAVPADNNPDAAPQEQQTGTHKAVPDATDVEQAAASHTDDNSAPTATTLRDMFEMGEVDGNLRMLYYANHNAFFLNSVAGKHNRDTASFGGKLGFTTAALHGFSLRLSAFAQRNFARSSSSNDLSETGYNRDLGRDISALGEAYLQYEQAFGDNNLRVRAGNQEINDAPFTSTYDFRIIPQVYQGVSARYGDDDSFLTVKRMYRYKSRISESYDRTTNYNAGAFESPPPNTTEETDGFWAVGAADKENIGAADISGEAWFLNYKDYANMYYFEGKVAAAEGDIQPFIGAQFIRETDDGRALLGRVDHHTYGAQLGLKRHSLTATLNYDYIPHERDSYLNGALVTPYAHNESSGPLFAQPYLTSTQDLGSGNAYAADINGAPLDNTFIGARYSYMDLTPVAGGESIGQSEYLVYAIYNFSGALEGFSVSNFFGYQTQKIEDHDYWENRLALEYSF